MRPIFEPANRCIYCESTDVALSDEHIFPRSMHGTVILPKSSCQKCARITSQIENSVCGKMFGLYREKAGFPRYNRRKKSPRRFTVVVEADSGHRRVLDLDSSQYPLMYPVPHLPPPGILAGATPSKMNPPMMLSIAEQTGALKAFLESLPGRVVEMQVAEFPWDVFCRLVAKVALGFARAERVELEEDFLRDVVLGSCSTPTHYVGCAGPDMPSLPPGERCVLRGPDEDGALICTAFRFPVLQSLPTYCAIVGRGKPQ